MSSLLQHCVRDAFQRDKIQQKHHSADVLKVRRYENNKRKRIRDPESREIETTGLYLLSVLFLFSPSAISLVLRTVRLPSRASRFFTNPLGSADLLFIFEFYFRNETKPVGDCRSIFFWEMTFAALPHQAVRVSRFLNQLDVLVHDRFEHTDVPSMRMWISDCASPSLWNHLQLDKIGTRETINMGGTLSYLVVPR